MQEFKPPTYRILNDIGIKGGHIKVLSLKGTIPSGNSMYEAVDEDGKLVTVFSNELRVCCPSCTGTDLRISALVEETLNVESVNPVTKTVRADVRGLEFRMTSKYVEGSDRFICTACQNRFTWDDIALPTAASTAPPEDTQK